MSWCISSIQPIRIIHNLCRQTLLQCFAQHLTITYHLSPIVRSLADFDFATLTDFKIL